MSYRRALLTRWSRRDRLTVLIIVVAVAFLTGTALVVVSVGSSTAGIVPETAIGPHVTSHASVGDAERGANPNAIVIPVSEVETNSGRTLILGVPANATIDGQRLGTAGTTVGTIEKSQQAVLDGPNGQVSRSVSPRATTLYPSEWYVSDPATVRQLGVTEVLVVSPTSGMPTAGTPLESALAFFLIGTRQVLATLAVAAGIGAILVGVTVYSVTRMTLRDREQELYVLRATGTTRWQVRRLFVLRATLLMGAGLVGGYALGVIATNIAVNVAVAIGVPTSLATKVTHEVVRFLVPTYAGVLAVGWAATLWAVQPVVSAEPADIGANSRSEGTSLPAIMRNGGPQLSFLSLRTAVPTAATLAAFVTFLLVVAGLAGAVGPLATTEDATITEPGSAHPIASQVPAAYATPLRDRGIAASPEILLFGVHDGEPYFARGAEYESFATLSNATLVTGRPPNGTEEAIIGVDLAETLDVDVGETLLVGGSVRRAVTRVEIVGTFDGPGPTDDQLVVSLATACHLTHVQPGRVQFIRAERLPESGGASESVAVTQIDAPDTVAVNTTIPVRVTVRNDGLGSETVRKVVRFGGSSRTIEVTVPANAERTATVEFTLAETGAYRLRAGARQQTVTVLDPDALRIRGLPEAAPPGSQPRLHVVNASGVPVSNATVTAGNWSGRTDAQGQIRLPLESEGQIRVQVSTQAATTTKTVQVDETATRHLQASLELSPSQPSLTDRPRLTVRLSNPWAQSVTESLSVAGPARIETRAVTVDPGETTTFSVTLPRRQPGQYEVAVRSESTTLAATTYQVTGDDRIVSALATSGRSGTTGIGRAAAVAMGNLNLALGTLLLLGAAMTIGGSGAAFVGAVHANRRTIGIHRAVGATRLQIVKVVLGDAIQIGGIAVGIALVLGILAFELLDRAGLLTVYGVRMQADLSWPLVGGIVLGGLLVVLMGAGLATATVLATEPATLLRGEGRR